MYRPSFLYHFELDRGKHIEIGPNFTYPVSRGLETGLAAPRTLMKYFLKCLHHSLHLFWHLSKKNHSFVPQFLKQVVSLFCSIWDDIIAIDTICFSLSELKTKIAWTTKAWNLDFFVTLPSKLSSCRQHSTLKNFLRIFGNFSPFFGNF